MTVDAAVLLLMLDAMADAVPPSNSVSDLLRRKPPREAVEWARSASGGAGRVLSIEPLPGGISHANHLIRIDVGGTIREVVLRRWVRTDWRETDPEFSPAQEASTYGLLASSDVPAPRLIAADVSGRACDVPALLITRAPGTRSRKPADVRSFLAQLAGVLPLVHGIDPDRAARTLPPYRPYYDRAGLDAPAGTRWPSVWQRAIEVATARPPVDACAFIHRDYHPGNTLWVSGKLTAVVDWTTASWGPPSVDLGHMRANLAISYGIDMADAFLDAYRAIVGDSYLHDPYWDLRVAVDFLPELPSDNRSSVEIARLEHFVARSVAAYGLPTGAAATHDR